MPITTKSFFKFLVWIYSFFTHFMQNLPRHARSPRLTSTGPCFMRRNTLFGIGNRGTNNSACGKIFYTNESQAGHCRRIGKPSVRTDDKFFFLLYFFFCLLLRVIHNYTYWSERTAFVTLQVSLL